MVEAVLRAKGLYSLKLTARTEVWKAQLAGGRWAEARQLHDGSLFVRASCERSVDEARFLLALDDDTSEFHRRFARDPLLGPSVRTLRGLRTTRTSTVAHAALRAICGQLIQSRRAREIERIVIRACGESPPSQEALARLSPAKLTGCGLAESRAATLARLVRRVDLESLKTSNTATALERLERERGIGPWSVGVIALHGLGRYDAGLVADLESREALRLAPRTLAGAAGGNSRALDAVRRVAGTRERLPACGLRARARPGRERRPRAARAQGVPARRVSEIAPDGSPVLLYARLPALGEAELIHAAVPAGSRILELGAGAGRITHRLIALGHEVVAVDNSGAMLAFIRGAETVLADMETLDLGRRFPVVVLASNFVNNPDSAEPPPVSRVLRTTRSSGSDRCSCRGIRATGLRAPSGASTVTSASDCGATSWTAR